MPRKKLTQEQQAAFDFVRTAEWLTEDQAVGCALPRYLTEERERSGLTIKEVAEREPKKRAIPTTPQKLLALN